MRQTVSSLARRAELARAHARSLPIIASLLAVASACSAKISAAGSGGSDRSLPEGGAAAVSGYGSAGSAGVNVSYGAGSGGSYVITRSEEIPGAEDPPTGCKNLQCQQRACASGSTTISGRVFDPAGRNPLYNVAVYVPNEAVLPFKPGASCDPCEALYSGKAVVSTLTDAQGRFTLENAPDGTKIPLVVQIGKWRKQVVIDEVAACTDNVLAKELTTLPRNRSEGDIPNIAIATGSADTLECLLRRVGVDASEYTPGNAGEGRVHIFQGSPRAGLASRPSPNTSPEAPLAIDALWTSADALMAYDVLLLSCEGQETLGMNQQALHDYADRGGRVFASHYHYAWFNTGPFADDGLAEWTTGSQDIGDITGTIVTSFPKGQALQAWLMNNNALVNGELPIEEARHNADVDSTHAVSQPWIVASPSSEAAGATQYFSFNTPTAQALVPDGKLCGRVVFSDLHVGAASNDNVRASVPSSCSDVELSPQEKALEFMLFDLSACVIPDDVPPEPPPQLN
jgi:hypothetical protein